MVVATYTATVLEAFDKAHAAICFIYIAIIRVATPGKLQHLAYCTVYDTACILMLTHYSSKLAMHAS